MRFAALVSGGKDSIYSILECIRNGHELVACVHMSAPDSSDEESYMYQTAASEVVRTLVEDCLCVPLLCHKRAGRSVNTTLVYQGGSPSDEVEDLFLALQEARGQFQIEAVSSGAILSTYQRVRIEHVCDRLGLTSLSYLWRFLPQKDLLERMLEDGIEAVLVRTACPPGLVPRRHLNTTLRSLWDSGLLERLHDRYQFHVCGEGGEYESLVIDSPLHRKKLVLDEVVIDEADDGVGILRINSCHPEEKGTNDIRTIECPIFSTPSASKRAPRGTGGDSVSRIMHESTKGLPYVKRLSGGLLHFSEVMSRAAPSKNGSEAELAVEEVLEIFAIVHGTLRFYNCTPQDVIFVHLYLSEISHFTMINSHYKDFFGSLLPPSRSCVALGKHVLPGGRRVIFDCVVQCGSGDYMRSSGSSSGYSLAADATKTSKLREVLHVQSISHWAPVCVGPYSQCNTIRSVIHFLAGQIGLKPSSMELHPTWTLQLAQCWTNIAAVLDALDGGSLGNLFSALIYVANEVRQEEGMATTLAGLCDKEIARNGGITPGRIDSQSDLAPKFGGYEDEGTWAELAGESKAPDSRCCPILVVTIPEMPKGAIVEVEVLAATQTAASSLEIRTAGLQGQLIDPQVSSETSWDTGHDFFETGPASDANFSLGCAARVLGHGCAASALVVASSQAKLSGRALWLDSLFINMLEVADKALAEARSGLGPSSTFHVRLFYDASAGLDEDNVPAGDDGVFVRTCLQTAVALCSKSRCCLPAVSAVPVTAIDVTGISTPRYHTPMFAMQILLFDMVHAETETWIQKDRNY